MYRSAYFWLRSMHPDDQNSWIVGLKNVTKVCASEQTKRGMKIKTEKAVEDRYEMLMTPAHFLVKFTDPCFKGESLTTDERIKVAALQLAISWTSFSYLVDISLSKRPNRKIW